MVNTGDSKYRGHANHITGTHQQKGFIRAHHSMLSVNNAAIEARLSYNFRHLGRGNLKEGTEQGRT
jgi:hypothetical protein